ncbi:MAG: DUF5348 domain-containing protein [Clostridium sp.]
MHEGRIFKNQAGRYALEDGFYWTSGDAMELFYDGEWLKGRVEHSTDYYFTDDDCTIPLETGMLAKGE